MKNESYKTREERLRYLIRAMQKEMPQYRGIVIPEDSAGQKQLLRSLMNVRPPMPADPEFLAEQDLYLSQEIAARGILDGADLAPVKENGRICLWQGDITRLKTGAIVNAANSALLGCFRPCHSCIDNIIHSYAGIQLRLACNEIMEAQGHEEPVGHAKLTPAGRSGYYRPAAKSRLPASGGLLPFLSGTGCGKSDYLDCILLYLDGGILFPTGAGGGDRGGDGCWFLKAE